MTTRNEVGCLFQSGLPWNEYGCVVGDSAPAGSLAPTAINVMYGQMDKFAPAQDTAVRGFPFSALKAARPQCFITSKGQPVYYRPSVTSNLGNPAKWEHAINIADSIFVNFWLGKYALPNLRAVQAALKLTSLPWIEADEGGYTYASFGTVANNVFTANAPWDSPFPQNATEYLAMVQSFFDQVHKLNTSVKIMPDLGSMLPDPTQFPKVFANCPGAMVEDLYGWHSNPTAYVRNLWYTQILTNVPWMGQQGKTVICRAVLPPNDSNALKTSFCVYELVKGANFFFAPGSPLAVSTSPSLWMGWNSALGSSTGPLTSVQPAIAGPGYRFYSRSYTGGTVYLNLTGMTYVIGGLSIPDLTGVFVTK